MPRFCGDDGDYGGCDGGANNDKNENADGDDNDNVIEYDLELITARFDNKITRLDKQTLQSWCVNERPLYAKAQVDLNVHSAKRYRVIGSVSNSKEFAKAFNCPVGSPMNPAKKCDLW